MQKQEVDEELEQEYKEFLNTTLKCNFQQSVEWGRVKTFWEKKLIVSRNKLGKIRGGALLWIRTIKPFGTLIYVSRGPVVDSDNFEALEDITNQIREVAKEKNAIALLLEPDMLSTDMKFRENILKLGYSIKGNLKDFSEQINPKYVFRLNLKGKTEDEVFANFHSKTRYNVRYAIKKGVEVVEGNIEDLKIFYKLMEETGKRDNFGIRPLEYFEKMYDEMQGHIKLILTKHEEDYLSGMLLVFYGNKVWYVYGASSNTKRKLMPNYLMQWYGIQQAIKVGADIYDFQGVPGVLDNEQNHPEYGLYRFKKNFGADFTEFIGQIYIAYKPFRYHTLMTFQKLDYILGGKISNTGYAIIDIIRKIFKKPVQKH